MKQRLGKRVNSTVCTATVLRWCSCITACEKQDLDMSRFMTLLTVP